jgi:hypothetical protein
MVPIAGTGLGIGGGFDGPPLELPPHPGKVLRIKPRKIPSAALALERKRAQSFGRDLGLLRANIRVNIGNSAGVYARREKLAKPTLCLPIVKRKGDSSRIFNASN